jgi:hypothetical protein
MFEVIITHRANFHEQVVGRFSEDEAYEVARQIADHKHPLIIRAWVREVREAPTEN